LDRRPYRAFEAIGGVPNLLVPDNTKVAVIKACLYEPQVNRTYPEIPDRDHPQRIHPQLTSRQNQPANRTPQAGDIMSEQRAT